jgi:hypothetical protein
MVNKHYPAQFKADAVGVVPVSAGYDDRAGR